MLLVVIVSSIYSFEMKLKDILSITVTTSTANTINDSYAKCQSIYSMVSVAFDCGYFIMQFTILKID